MCCARATVIWSLTGLIAQLAQWAASRVDIFPQQLCDRLGMLHSTTQPHPFKHTKNVIEKIFQRRFADVFEQFDQTPIGSGAIAQVRSCVVYGYHTKPTTLILPRFIEQHSEKTSSHLLTSIPSENAPGNLPSQQMRSIHHLRPRKSQPPQWQSKSCTHTSPKPSTETSRSCPSLPTASPPYPEWSGSPFPRKWRSSVV